MAHPTEKSKRLAELVRQSEASRLMLTGAHARLRHRLDLPSRIKDSITGAPAKWLGGSLVAGFATSLLFRAGKRRPPAKAAGAGRQRGFLAGFLAMMFTLSKPAVKIYATNLLRKYLAQRLTGSAGRTPPY